MQKKHFQLTVIVLWIFIGVSVLYAAPTRIMPLGDSITYDSRYADTRSLGVREGYRSHLYYKLIAANYSVDLVGSQIAGQSVTPPFDPENEGHPGWTSFEIAEDTYSFMTQSNPDIVLLHIGTNDRSTTSPGGIESILNEINYYEQNTGKTIRVIVALIIDRQEHDGRIPIFNRRVQEMLERRIINGDNITIVDMYHDAQLTSNDYIDSTHPNDRGYEKMATLWFNEIIKPYSPELYAYPPTVVDRFYIQSITVDEASRTVTFVTSIPDAGINF